MGQRLDILLRGGADMKIREGAYYRTRGGQVFGPMVRAENQTTKYIWRLSHVLDSWDEEGVYRRGWSGPFDLISEVYVSDTPPDAPLPDIITDQPIKTLRDEFAMRLMDRDAFAVGYKAQAEQLYRAADAMMEARKK
jgi:hypothetical protein